MSREVNEFPISMGGGGRGEGKIFETYNRKIYCFKVNKSPNMSTREKKRAVPCRYAKSFYSI